MCHYFDGDEAGYSQSNLCRFHYERGNAISRLFVGARLSTSLSSVSCHKVAYREHMTYLLIILLILVGLCLTPKVLPERLGLEWATPSKFHGNTLYR